MSRLQVTKEKFKEIVALNNNFPFGMLIGGITLATASIVLCQKDDCDGEGEAFAVIAGILLTILSIIYLYVVFYGLISETLDSAISTLLFVFWAGSAGFVTFEAPFLVAGNGFVAAWLGFISALGNLIYNVRMADTMKDKLVSQGLPLGILLIGSVIVAIAGLSNGCCDEAEVAAVVGGLVSVLLVTLRIIIGAKYNRLFGVFLAVWWTVLGLFLTFDEFEEIGNGFIATWLCIIASFMLVSSATIESAKNYSARISVKREQPPQSPPVNAYPTEDKDEDLQELF